ncbi:MAG: LptF/LptG family permease [Candidatus Eisenbacteria bacterium]
MRILPWYILRQHLVPFLLGFGVVTFILEMDVVFDYLDLIINRGVPVLAVLQLFGLSLGFVLALSVPCAVLVAELMTFGRLSQDNEITALRASGVHMFRVILPSLLVSVLLAVGLTLFNNHVYPDMNHSFASLLIDIGRMRPTVKLQEGVFINDFPGYNMLVQSVNGVTNELKGVTIYQLNTGAPPTTILAKSGFLTYTPDGRTAVLELKDGEIHEIPPEVGGPRRYHRLVFQKHILYMRDAGGVLERTVHSARGDREKSAKVLAVEIEQVEQQYNRSLEQRIHRFRDAGVKGPAIRFLAPERSPLMDRMRAMLAKAARRPDPADAVIDQAPQLRLDLDLWRMERQSLRKRIAELSVEYHKKFALPVACVVFVLLGAPIGMRVKRGGPAVAFMSIGFFLFYYICLIAGGELANRLILPPWLAIWLANIVLGVLGIDQTARACDVPLPWHRRRAYARTPATKATAAPPDRAGAA